MRPSSTWILLLTLLCGCFKTKDELTLEADGSGSVRIETRTSLSAERLASLGLGGRSRGLGEGPIYPPITKAEASKFFPAKDFRLTVKEETGADREQVVVVEAIFKDVNALLASRYARAHALILTIETGQLRFQAASGL